MPLTASKTVVAEHVDADQRQVRARLARLLDQSCDAAVVVQLGHPIMLRLARPAVSTTWASQSLVSKRRIRSLMPPWMTLSPRNITKRSSPRKSWLIFTAWARPSGRFLRDEGDLHAPAAPIADRLADLAGVVVYAHDDADVVDPGVTDRLDDPKQHRLVGHRHELFGIRVGDGIQARALAAAQDQTLSCADLHVDR